MGEKKVSECNRYVLLCIQIISIFYYPKVMSEQKLATILTPEFLHLAPKDAWKFVSIAGCLYWEIHRNEANTVQFQMNT